MIQMFLNFSYFSTNLDFVYLCLPLLTFVYLCSTNASMHKFCACFIVFIFKVAIISGFILIFWSSFNMGQMLRRGFLQVPHLKTTKYQKTKYISVLQRWHSVFYVRERRHGGMQSQKKYFRYSLFTTIGSPFPSSALKYYLRKRNSSINGWIIKKFLLLFCY